MEENIKILEDLAETLNKTCENGICEASMSIEKLIKGYRELEKQLDSSRKANELLNKTNNELRLEIRTTYSKVVNDIISKFNLGNEFIPKSKVKEKIEELKKELNNSGKKYGGCSINPEKIMKLENQIDILQELMEE